MSDKILFGVLAIIGNGYGIPCFLQGKVKRGVWRIVLGVLTCGVVMTINSILGIILGIKVLQMSDEEFAAAKDTLDSGWPTID